jgi:DNA modification methylase
MKLSKQQYDKLPDELKIHFTLHTGKSNTHPTLKPVDLMSYLIRLVTPKGGVTLDPFMGSGSTGKAAIREGVSFIGIEREPDYFEIAEARIDWELHNSDKIEYTDKKKKVGDIKPTNHCFWE